MNRKEAYPVYINLTQKNCRIIIPDFKITKELDIKTMVLAIENARMLIEGAAKDYEEDGKPIPVPDSAEYKKHRNELQTYVDVNLDRLFRKVRNLDELEKMEEDRIYSMWNVKENVIEFLFGQKVITATLVDRKLINRVRKYSKEFPEEVKILRENEDGSIFAKLPKRYLKLTRPSEGREFTEEEKSINRMRLEEGRLKWKQTKLEKTHSEELDKEKNHEEDI